MFKRTTALSVALLAGLLAMGGAAGLAAEAPIASSALVEQVGAPPAGGPTVSLLVKFKASATPTDIDAAIRGSGGSTARSFDQLRTRVITVPAGAATRILAAFAHLSTVERAAAAVTMNKAGDPGDPSYAQQWALPKIQWDQAYANVPITGSATIAVLDTGIDASHPDLAGRVMPGASETGGDPNVDPNGHGTALAGIAAANVNDGVGMAGVGYAGVSVMPVQVLGADGTGTDADVVAGVLWAADNGAQVILMGFSSADYSFALADAVQYAWDHGVVLIAATGNDGSSGYSYPAGMPNVIGVASTDENDAVAAGSNTGSASVAAPGVGILATAPGGGYTTISGTSASAAEAAGLAALLRANGATNAEASSQLRSGSDAVTGSAFGRINVAASFSADATLPSTAGTPAGGVVDPTYTAASTATFSGTVRSGTPSGPLIAGATVAFACRNAGTTDPFVACDSTTTNSGGAYSLVLNFGQAQDVQLTASAAGFAASSTIATNVQNKDTRAINFVLTASNTAPTATAQSVTTSEDTARVITLSGADADSASLTFAIATGPSHGTLGSLGAANCTPSGGGSNCTATVTYTPAANYNGPDSFTFTASDGTLTSAAATVSITVTEVNDAPTAVGDTKTTAEDTALAFPASDLTANDSAGPANESGQTLTVTAVTATGSTHGTVSLASGTITYTPAANYNGPASFSYTVTDNGTTNGAADPKTATGSVNVTVTPVNDAPTATAQSVTTNEDTGTAITLAGSDVETAAGNLSFAVATGPAHGSLSGTGASRTYTPAPDYNGPDSFTFTVTDRGDPDNCGAPSASCAAALTSAPATVSITVTPVNDAPRNVSITAAPTAIDENDLVTLSGTFSDPDTGDTHTVTIDWGDGSSQTTLTTLSAGTFTFTATHRYLDDNPTATASDVNTITATVTDNGTPVGTTTATTTVTVRNLAPAITTFGGTNTPMSIGSTVSVTANFTDVGTSDTHSCTFHWDDVSIDTTISAAGTGNGSCTATHTYAASDVYTVTVTVTDDDTGADTKVDPSFIVIYDANNGFVTGGGWINSPTGAYVADATLSGRANFGFVSKYQKGATVPTGNTEFQFQLGNLNFHSDVYQWLVISGARAQYKGTGSINGVAGYSFLLTATDGDVSGGGGVDKFRIKIWNTSTSAVVYDNAPSVSDDITASAQESISGGSIVLHK